MIPASKAWELSRGKYEAEFRKQLNEEITKIETRILDAIGNGMTNVRHQLLEGATIGAVTDGICHHFWALDYECHTDGGLFDPRCTIIVSWLNSSPLHSNETRVAPGVIMRTEVPAKTNRSWWRFWE